MGMCAAMCRGGAALLRIFAVRPVPAQLERVSSIFHTVLQMPSADPVNAATAALQRMGARLPDLEVRLRVLQAVGPLLLAIRSSKNSRVKRVRTR